MSIHTQDLRDLARPHFAKGYSDQIFDVAAFAQALLDAQAAEIAALRTRVRDLVLNETALINRDMERCAEIAALKADRDGWHQQASDRINDALQFASERDEARAEIAALRQDALRYRDLRKAAVYGMPSCEGSSQKQAVLIVTGYGDDESADLTDQAVDEAIAQVVQPS